MATKTIPAVMPGVQIDFLPDTATPTVTSKDVASHFQKKHKDVLRDIDRIRSMLPKDFHERNFAPMSIDVEIGNGAIRKDPAYRLTRDGFSLLAMGFTGKAAIQWKLRYIEAFNALERAALDRVQEAARLEGGQSALALAAQAYDRITPERMEKVRRAAYYNAKDLSNREVAKLLDCSHRSVQNYLQDARALGLRG